MLIQRGCLLTEDDPDYPNCAGTPNEYPDDEPLNHSVYDDGGIVEKGGPAI